MSTKSPKKVDVKRLAAALGDYRFAYLLTVDDDYRMHTVTTTPELREDALVVGLIGGRTRQNLESRSDGHAAVATVGTRRLFVDCGWPSRAGRRR